MQERILRYLTLLLYGALAAGGIWIGLKFLLPWAAPFMLAFGFASILERPVKAMIRHGFKRPAASGILSLGSFGILAGLLFFAASRFISEAADFIKSSPQFMQALGEGMARLENRVFSLSSAVPESVEEYIAEAFKAVLGAIYRIPAAASQKLLDFLGKTAQKSPSALLFSVTAALGSYFISASYPDTTAFIIKQLPENLRNRLKEIKKELKASLGGFLKAQLILMAMTFFQLLPAFILLRVESPLPAAVLISLIDALPVFGTGIVLVPWAVYSYLLGDYQKAVGFIILWGCVNLVRSCAQAKLTGDEIGLSPLASLAAVYIGWKVWGVGGMLLFPLLFAILAQLQEKGFIKLWNEA